MVTDINANVTQQVLYAPFGEVISESNAYWNNGQIPDFMFNAKELDEENGMYYYSARYYAPPVFTSRDPLFEKYPTISPYAYCANNPLKYMDPTGMEAKSPDDIFINTETQQLTVVKTNDNFDRVIVNGEYIGKSANGMAKDIWENEGLPTNEVSVNYSKSANPNTVSDYSMSVIIDVMNASGNTSIQINSTSRTPEDQARVMANNVTSQGMVSQKALYGTNGDKVLDLYPNQKAMVNKINELGPGNVSKHCADPSIMNVIDISSNNGGIKNPMGFSKAAQNHSGISRVLSPYSNIGEKAIHLEIPQNRK
jgi:RHS repeat-associated protein